MSRASRFILLLVIALAVSSHAVTAFAGPAGWESVDVTLHSEQQQSLLLVSGKLPAGAKLPAEAELAVPAGMQLQWIGETLGGDPSKDPELKYTKSSANGVDVYRFTLTKARSAQVEGVTSAGTTFDGTNYLTALKWTAWQAVPEVRISQRIPQGAQIVQAAPGATVQPGEAGYSFYTKTVKSPKAGDVLDLSFSYSVPAAGSTSTSGGSGSTTSTLPVVIIMLIAVGGFGLMAVSLNRKMRAKAALDEPEPRKSQEQAAQSTPAATRTTDKKKPDREPVVEAAPPKRMKLGIPTLVIVGIILTGFAIAGAKGSSPAVMDGKITRNFGAPSACQSASIPFTANQGVDIAKEAEQLLKGFEGMDGVGEVAIDIAQSKIDVAWCESSQTEDSMRQVLSGTGLITLGQGTQEAAPTPTAATIDESGSKQTVAVDTSSGSFAPSQLVLKAGVPAEIAFGPAVGCLTEVVIDDLGIRQDLTKGPATVKLPALEAGTYAFACGMGHQSGQVVVQ